MTVLRGESESDPGVLSDQLMAVLVCPLDKQDLRLEGEALVCTQCQRSYAIEDGIPNLLVTDGA